MKNSAGMPIGVQVVCPPHHEERTLRLMKEIEEHVCFREQHEAKGLMDSIPLRLAAGQFD